MTQLKPFHKGKVRDLYAIGEDKLLMIASDRVSAFDFVLPTPIPGKGELLNKISTFWFSRTAHIIKNHLITADPAEIERQLPAGHGIPLTDGAVLVKRAKRVDFECIVRGYITGSGWKEYLKNGTICGRKLPPGLKEAQKLPEPIFTPTSKADQGHDENVTFEEMAASLGREKAEFIKNKSLELYKFGSAHAEGRGIILADTKFEFGELDGEIILIDEALTPDSSRFWDAAHYKVGSSPESFDKQFVRDWLEKESGWDKKSAPPRLPGKVVNGTVARYREALDKLAKG
ncbi:MAG: phosphoribosylaminoimidazole-succinocarboxamide synthase [Elusimicrobia bacterium]|nr:MAG: phosphoribosylaminoimidazole-succinocarboxamide synthase [Elusimicrobiota bacterium]KAF0158021.1 MAG: phosphoribosylaminoimidazole-succinocarboxamide synthase [Elusimicrobiota bacterium]